MDARRHRRVVSRETLWIPSPFRGDRVFSPREKAHLWQDGRGAVTDRVQLYTLPISHYCVSAERMLAFKGVRYRRRPTHYHEREELLQVSGQDYVPTMLWNGQVVTWNEIPEFLDRVHPDPPLLPAGLAGLARSLENWGHQVVEERVWRAVVTQVPATFRDPVERWVFEEMQTRSRGPWHVLKARRKEFLGDLWPYFHMIDEMLKGREWLLDQPTLADFGIYGGLSPWMTVGERIPPRYRNLARWVARVGRL